MKKLPLLFEIKHTTTAQPDPGVDLNALEITLIGTVEADKENASAAIKFQNSPVREYSIGQKIAGATLVGIARERITLRFKRYLRTFYTDQRQVERRDDVSNKRASKRREFSSYKVVSREKLNWCLANYVQCSLGSTFSLESRRGKMIGIKLRKLTSQSLLAQLGFRRADLITAVNDQKLNNTKAALELLNEIRLSSLVKVKFIRETNAHEMTFHIRN